MKKTSGFSKVKLVGLITLITGGLIAGGIAYNNKNTDKKTVEKELMTNTTLTVDQLEWLIQQADTTLTQLKNTINSQDATPEQRHEARNAHREILKNQMLLKKKLEIAKSKQNKDSIEFETARQVSR